MGNSEQFDRRASVGVEELLEAIDQLSPSERVELGQRMLGDRGNLAVVPKNWSAVAASLAFRDSSVQEMSEVIKHLPRNVLSDLLKAIAICLDREGKPPGV